MKTASARHTPWSAAEDARLRSLWRGQRGRTASQREEACARALGRTEAAVRWRSYTLGLTRRPDRGKTICRHCDRDRYIEGRGLCGRCYKTPAIRAVYPMLRDVLPRGRAPEAAPSGIDPHAPTAHPPGSPEKEAVLKERAAAGLPLFHRGDARHTARCYGVRGEALLSGLEVPA